jgi:hypothetical protein
MRMPLSVLYRRLYRVYTAMRHAAANTQARVSFFCAVAVVTKWPALRTAGSFNDKTDAQHFTLFEEAARLAVVKFHQLPLWNPYYCGGIPGFGTPSARFVSPTFLLSILFGTIRADVLVATAMTLVGLEGAFRYARARGGGALGAVLAAPVFALSGYFGRWQTHGWTNFFAFELVPWALLGARMALGGSRRGVVVLALAVAWMIGFGGTYAAPITALAILFEGAEAIVKRIRSPYAAGRVVLMGALAGLFVVLTSLVRLWPIAEVLSAAPRVLEAVESRSAGRLWTMLFGDTAHQFRRADFLVGLPALPLFFLGTARRRARLLVVAGILWIWFSVGYGMKASIFAAIRHVPPYTMLRAPERFLELFTLVFVVIAALAVRRVEVAARRNPAYAPLAVGCLALLACDLVLLVQNDAANTKARSMVAPPPIVDRDFHQSRGNRWLAAYYPPMSRGVLACFDDYNIVQSPDLAPDLQKEEYLLDPEAGTVERRAWSPDRIDLGVDLSRPARVYVNQNWHPGWHSNAGSVVSAGGLLAVDLPAGHRDLTLHFWPRSGLGGGATSLAALVVAAIAWRRSRRCGDTIHTGREWARDLLLFASPVGVALLSFVAIREPKRPPPPRVTRSGEPIVADAPPPDATSLGARWGDGVMLEAARYHLDPSPRPEEQTITLELDWRLDEKVPADLAAFVHFEGGPGRPISVNSAQLSGTLLFADAPLHVTLRDEREPTLLPRDGKPVTWKVYAGLYHALSDAERLKDIVSPGNTTAREGRVLVATFDVP